jgi:hypothetical protein
MTDKEFEDYWAYLVEKRHSAKAALSCDERVFYAANLLRGSVPRDGLIGYFENTECDAIREAHHALATLGVPEALRLLQAAQEIVVQWRWSNPTHFDSPVVSDSGGNQIMVPHGGLMDEPIEG